MRVLNVGGGASREIPRHFTGWDQDLLDIDPDVRPDLVCDAKQLRTLPKSRSVYDAVFCSHNLEHFYKHEVPQVLAGFIHVLKPTGFAQVAVPDMQAVFEAIVSGAKDIDDTWYTIPGAAIHFHDVIYGWQRQVETGNVYYAHKTGFTEKSLAKALRAAGFPTVCTARDGSNLHAFAFRVKPSALQRRKLGL